MFENKMNSKDIHVFKKSPNPYSPLMVQVPGEGENVTVYIRKGKGKQGWLATWVRFNV